MAPVLLVLLALVVGATPARADVSRPLKRFMVFGENPFGCVVVGHDLVLDPAGEAVVARASTECDGWAGFKLREIGAAATIEEHHWWGWNDVATQVRQDGAERTQIEVEARVPCKHDQRYRLMAEGRVRSNPTDIGVGVHGPGGDR